MRECTEMRSPAAADTKRSRPPPQIRGAKERRGEEGGARKRG
jgi:hypothetical protein